jgi:hypothetical protein
MLIACFPTRCVRFQSRGKYLVVQDAAGVDAVLSGTISRCAHSGGHD